MPRSGGSPFYYAFLLPNYLEVAEVLRARSGTPPLVFPVSSALGLLRRSRVMSGDPCDVRVRRLPM